jgi:YD repeat-containing protein
MAEFDYMLNADGTKRSETDSDAGGTTAIYTWGYDGLSRLTSETFSDIADPSANYITTYGYDMVGNRLSKATDQAATTMEIDAFNSNGSFAADQTVTYAYDNNDRLTSESDDAAGTYSQYTYGPLNAWTMQTDKTVYIGSNNTGIKTSQTHFDYDDQGRMTGSTVTTFNTDGSVASCAFD